jgi:hypothetical protein
MSDGNLKDSIPRGASIGVLLGLIGAKSARVIVGGVTNDVPAKIEAPELNVDDVTVIFFPL